jgi:thiamine biosynthesis lipoprotein
VIAASARASSFSFAVMGTGATIRITDGAPPRGVVGRIRSRWSELEQRFSLYRPDSELSQVADGRISLLEASAELRAAYEEAVRWREETNGDFTPHRPDGVLDLDGIVKAHALRDAAAELDAAGMTEWLVDIGGDVVVADAGDQDRNEGRSAGAARTTWRAGIADPHDPTRLLTAVPLGERWTAIATSGTSERGEHVWRSRRLGDLVQVTVLSRDIVQADVLATAILAGGLPALEDATARHRVDVLTVDARGALRVTPALRRVIQRTA